MIGVYCKIKLKDTLFVLCSAASVIYLLFAEEEKSYEIWGSQEQPGVLEGCCRRSEEERLNWFEESNCNAERLWVNSLPYFLFHKPKLSCYISSNPDHKTFSLKQTGFFKLIHFSNSCNFEIRVLLNLFSVIILSVWRGFFPAEIILKLSDWAEMGHKLVLLR